MEAEVKLVKLDTDYWPNGGYGHWCPGCNSGHEINVKPDERGVKWTFDGNMERPTFTPSVNLQINPPGHQHYQPDLPTTVCHYILTAGRITFCGDCTHALVGQTVDLPDIPPGKYVTSIWRMQQEQGGR